MVQFPPVPTADGETGGHVKSPVSKHDPAGCSACQAHLGHFELTSVHVSLLNKGPG